MNHLKIINDLILGFDLSQRSEANRAYRKCLDYADEHFSDDMQCNTFINEAAKLLHQPKVLKNTAEQKAIANTHSKIHLYFSESNGPCLVGNKDGLRYLSEVTQNLSRSSLPGEHIHLYYNEFPLYGDSYALTIYYENDDWFKTYAQQKPADADEEQTESIPKRNFDIDSIYAFMANTEPPPTMPIISNKIYKVTSITQYTDQKIWKKEIRDSKERMIVASFINEDDTEEQFAFDIDDKAIVILTKSDVIQLIK